MMQKMIWFAGLICTAAGAALADDSGASLSNHSYDWRLAVGGAQCNERWLSAKAAS